MPEQIQREWVRQRDRFIHRGDILIKREERKEPLKECPNCGEYSYTEYRTENIEMVGKNPSEEIQNPFISFIALFRSTEEPERQGWEKTKKCSECKYSKEVE